MKQWQSFNLMEQNMFIDEISEEFIQAMDGLCKQCGITSDHFINPTFEIIDENMYTVVGIYYRSNFIYSSSEGNVTASTMVTLLQDWLLEAEENEMQVTVGEAHLVIYKPCSLTNNSPTSKLLCLTSLSRGLQLALSLPNGSQTQTSVVIVGTFVGGMLAGTICSVIAAISWSAEKVAWIKYCLWYILISFLFVNAVCLYTKCFQVIPLTLKLS